MPSAFMLKTASGEYSLHFVLFDEVNYFVSHAKGQAGYRVCAAVIYGNTTSGSIGKGGAGESYIGHVPGTFVNLLRGNKVRAAAGYDLPGLI
jgi:hypothetical protein